MRPKPECYYQLPVTIENHLVHCRLLYLFYCVSLLNVSLRACRKSPLNSTSTNGLTMAHCVSLLNVSPEVCRKSPLNGTSTNGLTMAHCVSLMNVSLRACRKSPLNSTSTNGLTMAVKPPETIRMMYRYILMVGRMTHSADLFTIPRAKSGLTLRRKIIINAVIETVATISTLTGDWFARLFGVALGATLRAEDVLLPEAERKGPTLSRFVG